MVEESLASSFQDSTLYAVCHPRIGYQGQNCVSEGRAGVNASMRLVREGGDEVAGGE